MLRTLLLVSLAPLAAAQIERQTVQPLDPDPYQFFGQGLALEGNLVLVGAVGDDEAGENAGAGYLFDAATGDQLFKLMAPNMYSLGQSAAIGNGRALLGGPFVSNPGYKSGTVVMFDVASGALLGQLAPSPNLAESYFGWDVDVREDLVLVGARGEPSGGEDAGAAYLFDAATGAELHKLIPNNLKQGDGFGWSVALDGNFALVGAPFADAQDRGAAYLFHVSTGAQVRKYSAAGLGGGDAFGIQVAIDGDFVAVAGFPGPLDEGAVWIFDRATGTELARIDPPAWNDEWFGYDLDLEDGVLVVGTPHDGHAPGLAPPGKAYLYDVATQALLVELKPSDSLKEDSFGWRVALDDGQVAVSKGYAKAYLHCIPTEIGERYCDPAVVNSSGSPATITVIGATEIACQDLVLRATDVPVGQFGYFLTSQVTDHVPMVGGGQGTLCLGGPIARFQSQTQNSGDDGAFEIRVDVTSLPTSPSHAIQPGETWHFQGWFRDKNPHNTWNFTEGVSVTFD